MLIVYLAIFIVVIVAIFSDRCDFWDNLLCGTLAWVMCVGVCLVFGIISTEAATQEIVETKTYNITDFSDYYVGYEENTYLVIKDGGDLVVRYEDEDEVKEVNYSRYSIEFTEEDEYTVTYCLKDAKSKVLRHLFWNFNNYDYIITVPKDTPLVYQR